MRPVRLGRLELRRFTRSRLTRAALAGVVLLPLLYAGLYLWSFWDPQGNMENIPVALVMEDRPAKAGDKTIDAGRDLVRELQEREVFSWHRVSAREAADGVNDGSFYLSLTVPADFSARLASPSSDGTPTPAELGVTVDTGRSYIMGTISDAVFAEVKEAASRTAIKDYWDSVFVSFGELHDATAKAADGADKLHDGNLKARDNTGRLGEGATTLRTGLGQARDGTRRLTVGLNDADTATGKLSAGAKTLAKGLGDADTATGKLSAGAKTLAKGLGDAESGSRKLGRGLVTLKDGARQVADGNAQAYRQVHAQTARLNQLADEFVPALEANGARLQALARAVEKGADLVARGVGGLPAGLGQEAGQSRQQAERLLAMLENDPDVDPGLRAAAEGLIRSTRQVEDGVASASAGGDGSALAQLQQDARRISETAGRMAALAPDAGRMLDQARDKVNQLDEGLGKLADGSAKVHEGLGSAATANAQLTAGIAKLGDGSARLSGGLAQLDGGITKLSDGSARLSGGLAQLDGGITKLSDGAAKVDTGVGRLSEGAGKLDNGLDRLSDGLGKLADGSRELSEKLGDGVQEIPDYGRDERESRTGMMSEPVTLASRVVNEVPNYGTGFAPFFVPLALWVGAMVTYMVLRPLNPRLLAGTASAWRIAVAGWLPGLALGAAQVGVLLAVLRFGLGLEAAHWAGVAGLLLLTTAAFVAIVQAVNALLGAPGRVAVLALLMLQLTSAAGTYPIETSPGFFQTISPWLPMSWVVSALRRLISGGDLTVAWQAGGVLVLFTALGLTLSGYAVHKGRTWTMRRLHPELAL
ncbi:YhgE/Pip domain-containing protein [Planomonospora sp. ID67723]|uniref:YhgE/Pip domain-containing protein n=1 Tax=Planomonospora sp. ID67723 TaxID=2738134 RepID=UPI0018C3D3EC|nr:YhgE/Pip domain-containing protein [Planomonospora sp. ID67723]MBG0828165.1 YhgE/Pip domain-containing protein [Planomonospora sp. ID67723]